MHAGNALTISLRFRYGGGEGQMNLVTKDSEYLLRLSPVDGGMRPFFFVYAGGAWGAPVSGPILRKGDDVSLVAVWSGEAIYLFTNGLVVAGGRRGEVAPVDTPLIIGKGSSWAPVPLDGEILEQSLVPGARSLADILRASLGMTDTPGKTTAPSALNEMNGWQVEGGHSSIRYGELRTAATGPVLRLLRTGLDIDLQGLPELGLSIGSTARNAQLVFVTTKGARSLPIDLPEKGEVSTVLMDMRAYWEWSGRLLALGILLDDRSHVTQLRQIRVEAKPTLAPRLQLTLLETIPVLPRVDKPFKLKMKLTNAGGPASQVRISVLSHDGLSAAAQSVDQAIQHLDARATQKLEWQLTAHRDGHRVVRLKLDCAEAPSRVVEVPILVLAALKYVPTTLPVPVPVSTAPISLGMMTCPLWRQGSRGGAQSGWNEITPFPQRQSALGWYDEGNPEVTDWEIRWAVEHGLEFFMCCWYRAAGNIGKPVVPWLNHWVESLNKAKYAQMVKYSILWENIGAVGVSSADDMMQNLLPFWIENNFKHPNYMRREGKPVLYVYGVQKMVDDLGGEANTRRVIRQMRAACEKAGLGGLILMGANHTSPSNDNSLAARIGFDAMWAYHWPTASDVMPANYTNRSLMELTKQCWAMQAKGRLPRSNTVSFGWDARPWGQKGAQWHLTPGEFQEMCVEARRQALAGKHWAEKIVMFDNWNEFGEGHYLSPTRGYGFEYLDVIRKVFAPKAGPHTDLLPEDVGQGPYQKLFTEE
ncbi:MAG: glycoside hydrolase family 99-like domain-containing protein [Armatimonadota bacterium]